MWTGATSRQHRRVARRGTVGAGAAFRACSQQACAPSRRGRLRRVPGSRSCCLWQPVSRLYCNGDVPGPPCRPTASSFPPPAAVQPTACPRVGWLRMDGSRLCLPALGLGCPCLCRHRDASPAGPSSTSKTLSAARLQPLDAALRPARRSPRRRPHDRAQCAVHPHHPGGAAQSVLPVRPAGAPSAVPLRTPPRQAPELRCCWLAAVDGGRLAACSCCLHRGLCAGTARAAATPAAQPDTSAFSDSAPSSPNPCSPPNPEPPVPASLLQAGGCAGALCDRGALAAVLAVARPVGWVALGDGGWQCCGLLCPAISLSPPTLPAGPPGSVRVCCGRSGTL